MFKSAILAAAAAATLAPGAASAETRELDRDGVSASYVRTTAADGTVRIEGRYRTTGQRFRYTVSPSGRVRGDVGGQVIEFTLEEAKQEMARAAS